MNHSTDAAASDALLSRVTVIIPALNEERSLPLVLRDLPPVGQVIVVDNGSTDATATVAERAGARVLWEPQRGYGSACLRGLAEIEDAARRGQPVPAVVVFLDADYSDHPELLPELVAPILAGDADLVLGSRWQGEREPGAMPPQSLYGNQLACFLLWLLFGARYTDLGPFRAIDYVRLRELEMTDENFGWTVEMQIKAARAGLRVKEIPAPYRKRIGSSKISGTVSGTIRASVKILYMIAWYGLQRRQRTSNPSLCSIPRPSQEVVEQEQTEAGHRSLAVLAVLSACLYGVVSLLSRQFEFDSPTVERPIILVLSLFAAAFLVYLFAIRVALRAPQDRRLLKLIFGAALLFRALLLPSVPIQEIDIYRYLWDGAVVVQGINPFRYSPAQVSAARASPTADAQLAGLARLCDEQPPLAEVLRRIHYGELPTIYPPISQAVFAAATLTTPDSSPLPARVFVMKCWFIVFDVATLALVIYLLRLCARPVGWSIAYGWCPLLLKEVANSGHLDAVAVFLATLAVVLAVRLLVQLRHAPQTTLRVTSNATLVAICLALAIGAKLYPVVLAPLIGGVLATSLGWRRSLVPVAAFLLVTLLVVWPLLPEDPAGLLRVDHPPASDQPPIPPAALPPPPSAASAAGDPSLGITTFLRRWEMNDFIFLIVVENLKPAAEPIDGLPAVTPWFSVLPEPMRRWFVSVASARVGIDEAEVPFAVTRAVTLLIFFGLAAWFACRAALRADVASFCEAAFLTIAWFWLLCPTQNPWYWTWALPLLAFARGRAWLAVSGLVLMYYLRFWFSYHWPDMQVWGTGYVGVTFFDFVIAWIQYAPWFVWLAVDSWRSGPYRQPDSRVV